MSDRVQVSSGAPWESRVGYSRAVRVGVHVAISGTCAVGHDGQVVGLGDPAEQTRHCIEIIRRAIEEAGGCLEDVVRTRVFVRNVADWEPVARAHGERFAATLPANTLVEAKLVSPDALVEIEADAEIPRLR